MKVTKAKLVSNWKKLSRFAISMGAKRAAMIITEYGQTRHVWLVNGYWIDRWAQRRDGGAYDHTYLITN